MRVLPRDRIKGNYVLKQQGYKCQIDESHKTFTTKNGNIYMEKHHLIPMEYYDSFEYSLDDISNIVSLCPTCHRKIHLGEANERNKMIEKLFAQQGEKIKSRLKISITANDIKRLYTSS